MKYVLLLVCTLVLAGCCNGTGPGPGASANNHEMPSVEDMV
ncbi:hypothetical protein [Vibrio albus]|nr:hypothetical protein [Vibrio albus]